MVSYYQNEMEDAMDQNRYHTTENSAQEASFGGSRLRMQYETMEEQKKEPKASRWETILFSVAFTAALLMVMMVLVATGSTMF